MKAVYYETFGQLPALVDLPEPEPPPDGVVIQVKATGLCRSDWLGWMGHDPDIRLPHVPGHELAGVVTAVGSQVRLWQAGNRVTVPFVCGCGQCPQCQSGNHQVCDHQFQPGFTHWGSFAEFVAIARADTNLVRLPDEMDFVTAASLGCRFTTAFRAMVDQGRVTAGQWVAVHGCGGVGLSAIMIANALGANVIAVDIADEKLKLAQELGAVTAVHAVQESDVAAKIKEITGGGVHVSLDALGSPATCFNSIANLRKRGRHIQVGIMVSEERHTAVPLDRVIANELEILGSHGMQAFRFAPMFDMIRAGKLAPAKLVGQTITLADAPQALANMNHFPGTGITVILPQEQPG